LLCGLSAPEPLSAKKKKNRIKVKNALATIRVATTRATSVMDTYWVPRDFQTGQKSRKRQKHADKNLAAPKTRRHKNTPYENHA
jgi:hypothetical protein